MNTNQLYDPEDIESLLEHKSFNELYPEERQFVLRHIDSEREYESLRETLLTLRGLVKEGSDITPDKTIRRNVLSAFEAQHKRPGFSLNSWFLVFTERFNGFKPALAFGVLVGAIAISSYFYFANSSEGETLADNHVAPRANRTMNSDGGVELEVEELEVISQDEAIIPPATDMQVQTLQSEEVTMYDQSVTDENSSLSFVTTGETSAKEELAEKKLYTDMETESVMDMDDATITQSTAPAAQSITLSSQESVQVAIVGKNRAVATAKAPVVEKVYFNWVKSAY